MIKPLLHRCHFQRLGLMNDLIPMIPLIPSNLPQFPNQSRSPSLARPARLCPEVESSLKLVPFRHDATLQRNAEAPYPGVLGCSDRSYDSMDRLHPKCRGMPESWRSAMRCNFLPSWSNSRLISSWIESSSCSVGSGGFSVGSFSVGTGNCNVGTGSIRRPASIC